MRFQTLLEGRYIFAALLALAAVAFLAGWSWLIVLALLLMVFCLSFFRDPERAVPPGDEVVVAAADGVVCDLEELEETEVLLARCKRVGIFLSVLDVHVNKAPIAGKIIFYQHSPGEYLDARNPGASSRNEALTWAFEGASGTVVVRQITGAIARRLVPWSKLGDVVPKGFRFGMIRFGSRTEVYLPINSEVTVKIGEHVLGGATVIARLR